jgi:hypothetical protein
LFKKWHVKDRKDLKILLYLGRISEEKQPEFFVEVVSELPADWIGIMVGPSYYNHSMPLKRHPRVRMVGRWDNGADPLSIADVALMASSSEGGPIVLLEAWAMKVPFFMRKTGLGAAYPENIFTIYDDETPKSVARRVAKVGKNRKAGQQENAVEKGLETVRNEFALTHVASKWKDYLLAKVQERQQCNGLPYVAQRFGYFMSEGVTVSVEGHHRIFYHPWWSKDPSIIGFDLILAFQNCADPPSNGYSVVIEYELQAAGGPTAGSCAFVDPKTDKLIGSLVTLNADAHRGTIELNMTSNLNTTRWPWVYIYMFQGSVIDIGGLQLIPHKKK